MAQTTLGELDQEQEDDSQGSVRIGESGYSQSFTAGKTGKLDKVSLRISCCYDNNGFRMEPPREATDGTLHVKVAGTEVTIPGEEIFLQNGFPYWKDISIDPAPEVIAGLTYYIDVWSEDQTYQPLWRTAGNVYSGGYFYGLNHLDGDARRKANDNNDAAFRTYVIPSDSVAPQPVITSGPDEGTTQTTNQPPTFEFSTVPEQNDASFECALDSSSWEECTSSKTYTEALSDGNHTFQVRQSGPEATDVPPAVRHWWVDTTAPDTKITGSTPAIREDGSTYTANAFAIFNLGVNGIFESGTTFKCSLDGKAWSTCTSPFSTSRLTEGEHVFQAAAVDRWGNTDPDPASRRWTVDLTPPTTTAEATTSDNSTYTTDTWTNKDVTLALSAKDNEGGSGVKEIRYSVDGATETAVPGSSAQVPVIDSDGTHTVKYRAIDNVNRPETAKTFTIKLDKTGPSVLKENGTAPKDGDTNVSRSIKEITATVSDPLDPKTVTTTTVQLFSGNSKTPLKAQVSLSSDGKTVTLTPQQKLDAKTKYTAKILGGEDGVKDLLGNLLEGGNQTSGDYWWSFTTGSQ